MDEFLIFILFWVAMAVIGMVISAISKTREKFRKAALYDEFKLKIDTLDQYKNELDQKEKQLLHQQKYLAEKKKSDIEEINKIAEEKSSGFPWLAAAYADYFHLQDMKLAKYLEFKPHPAKKSAQHLREIASKRRIAEKVYRVLKYQLEYYEKLFPWLIDFKGEDVDDLISQLIASHESVVPLADEPKDPVQKWVTPAEFKLPTVERNQRALDRYWQRPKSKWEIGRDYERFVGYIYEAKGYQVYYQGIVEGLNDLGRDLVAKKDDAVEIIQCKNWSERKTIHEKHIFQLFGTTVEYWLKYGRSDQDLVQMDFFPKLLKRDKIKATFITSTSLSPVAKDFAKVLNVSFSENYKLQRYPSIKCNVSRRTGEKIYHLPFDQQYDTTIIEEERNECYVETVKEAEDLGFRRAFRWKGKDSE
jgi:hypothetical protein